MRTIYGLCPPKRRTRLGPTGYKPRCSKCLKPLGRLLGPNLGRIVHFGRCDKCEAGNITRRQ